MPCVYAKTLYTGREMRADAWLIFDGWKIKKIAARPEGEVVGEFATLTPALVDPHCHIGMNRPFEGGEPTETNERQAPFTVGADALDAVLLDDPSFRESIEAGVLYSCVTPGSGNIIGGKTAVIRNYARNTTDALIGRAGLKAAFGHNPRMAGSWGWKGDRPSTRMGALDMLRRKFAEVSRKEKKYRAAKGEKKKEIAFTAEEETLRAVLAGKETLRCHAHKADDIAAVLRVVDEYRLRVTLEHTMDVFEQHVYDELKKRKIPVIYGPITSNAQKTELRHSSWRNVLPLVASGVTFGLMSDHAYAIQSQLRFHLRHFLRAGMTRQRCIELVTRVNAELIGQQKHFGTLAKGRWASFVGWNGDPLDMGAWPVAVYGEGEAVYNE